MRLSIMVEWANTRLNGVPRAWELFQALVEQWEEIGEGRYPQDLPAPAARFLDQLDRRAEVVLASGEAFSADLEGEIRRRLRAVFDVELVVAEGMEYYPLKTAAARRATGDLLLFVDSDVLPEPGWLAQLLGSFGRPEIDVVAAQTYIAPTDFFGRVFALSWSYPVREPSSRLFRPAKFHANTLAFRRAIFPREGFPPIGARTRGAASLLRRELARRGIAIWQNQGARVDHPPPASFLHLAVRGLAHGRDFYMVRSEDRNLFGLANSVGIAAGRLSRACYRTLRHGRRVGLRPWELPAALALTTGYYACFALGGVLTHASPRAMRKRFRV